MLSQDQLILLANRFHAAGHRDLTIRTLRVHKARKFRTELAASMDRHKRALELLS